MRGSLINFSRSSQPRPEWLGERRERHHAFSQDLFGPWAGNEANSRGRESLARTSNPINIVATRAAGGFSDSLPPILERIHHSTRLSNNLQRPGPFSRVWKILQYRRHQSHTRLYICAQHELNVCAPLALTSSFHFPLPKHALRPRGLTRLANSLIGSGKVDLLGFLTFPREIGAVLIRNACFFVVEQGSV